jgi:sugar phosphate isomerase/epimerase
MQLGISSLGHIIENGLSGKYSNLTELLLQSSENCLDYAEKNDIKVVELVLDPPEVYNEKSKQMFIDLVNSYSIKKQIHGPFIDLSLCSHNLDICKASIDSYYKVAMICNEINSKMMTIHPGYANFLINSVRKYNTEQLAKSVNSLLKLTNKLNVIVCLENMPKNCNIMLEESDIEDIINKINNNIYLTYDTSHFFTCSGNVQLLWEKFHNIIKNVHIVDNYSKKSDTHPCLGTGKINFKEIFETINIHNYKGSLIIELSSPNDLELSIEFLNKFF